MKETTSLKASLRVARHVKTIFQLRKNASRNTEHGFKHKGNHNATLPWLGTKIAQQHAKRIKTKR